MSVRARILSQLAEVAVQAAAEGDDAAIAEIVEYLANDPAGLSTVFSLALGMARGDASSAP